MGKKGIKKASLERRAIFWSVVWVIVSAILMWAVHLNDSADRIATVAIAFVFWVPTFIRWCIAISGLDTGYEVVRELDEAEVVRSLYPPVRTAKPFSSSDCNQNQ